MLTAPLLFLWGAFLQKAIINRVLNALPQNQILLTIGLGLIMSNSIMLAFTSDYRILTTSYSSSSFSWAASRSRSRCSSRSSSPRRSPSRSSGSS